MNCASALKALKAFGVNGYDEYLRWVQKRKIGFIVNPIAGMGGKVGLKGTDNVYKLALKLGAKPVAPLKAVNFLRLIRPIAFELLTYPLDMGENEARQAGLKATILGSIGKETTANDTKRAAKEMARLVELLVFVGGDGTARDVYEAVGDGLPVLGVPAGVKMHSSVFAFNVKAAADTVVNFIRYDVPCELREVMDVDEGAFRRNRVSAKLYGFMKVPVKGGLIQPVKRTIGFEGEKLEIARCIAETMKPNTIYIVGPGTTTYSIASYVGFEKTLLGVDVVLNGKTVVRDANERQILSNINSNAKIIVSPIGGQGFIFGRGNQQISAEVLKTVGKENVIVVATKSKLSQLSALRVDTGSLEVDAMLKGKIRVITGYEEIWFDVA